MDQRLKILTEFLDEVVYIFLYRILSLQSKPVKPQENERSLISAFSTKTIKSLFFSRRSIRTKLLEPWHYAAPYSTSASFGRGNQVDGLPRRPTWKLPGSPLGKFAEERPPLGSTKKMPGQFAGADGPHR